MREALILLVGEEVNKKVVIGMAKDGSAIGGEPRSLCTEFILTFPFPKLRSVPLKP